MAESPEWSGKWDASSALPAVTLGVVKFRTLTWVDRTDHPGGAGHGSPGLPINTYIAYRDDGAADPSVRTLSFAELVAEGSQYVLFGVEVASPEPVLVFLKLKPAARRALYENEAFIDRGIRKLVELGSPVAFCSLATAEAYVSDAAARVASGEWRVSFVWNTGRCGSTLLHKALLAHGVASLSEPHWLDQLLKAKAWQDAAPAELQRALRVCALVEARLATRQRAPAGWTNATSFSFNPKMGHAVHLQEAATLALPAAKHLFMYRACHKVVHSFAGLLGAPGLVRGLWERLVWWYYGQALLPPPKVSRLKDCLHALPLAELSSSLAASLTQRWLESVLGWLSLQARYEAGEEHSAHLAPIGTAPSLRMDELTTKDAQARLHVLRGAFVALGLASDETTPAELANALASFETHSQAGSAMSGPKKAGLLPADEPLICTTVLKALEGVKGVTVESDGANVLLPSSIGA
ncbi:hypothetical protein AB1Y20_012874 [Prymnesium parvum]|uniref:Uncharacterized protein n=1 Tax=Prymnesium parvum TaxID=97485 RepID=A0AB34IJN6_PRYPA